MPQSDTRERAKTQLREPPQRKVVFWNDDYTPMTFVVDMLRRYFEKDTTAAHGLMLSVHRQGHAVAGVYTAEIAESKAALVTAEARQQGFPLRVTAED